MPFVKRDLDIVQRNFETKIIEWPKLIHKPFSTILDLFKNITWADVVICWFASYHTLFSIFFAKILKKKSVIITGGYDVISVPEIKYGIFYSPFKSKIVKWTLENADLVLPFSEYAKTQLLMRVKPKKVETIYLVCESDKFKPNDMISRENLVITVCMVTKDNVSRKGLLTFVQAAKELSSVRFAIIGPHVDSAAKELKKIAPDNLELPGFMPEPELIKWYQRAKVYGQLSFEEGEGIGGALGEGMAAGCAVIVSEKAEALKEIVQDKGLYVSYGDKDATVKAIINALERFEVLGQKARNQILPFNSERRKKELTKAINEL